MTKRFVLATSNLTPDQERRLKDEFGSAAWWHWLPNFWLLKDKSDKLAPLDLVETVKRIGGPDAHAIALEVDHKVWATLDRPDPKGQRMADWLRSTWTTP